MPALLSSCLGFSFLISSLATSEEDTVVVTSTGPIKGKQVPAGSGSVTAYLGIPYAEPPLGKLRFQKPIPHQPWSHVLEATSFGNACHQFNISNVPDSAIWTPNRPLSEDCLFLNIWVPHPWPSMLIPVLVWIHGGGFLGGSSSLDLYNGEFLAVREGVIVVSLNYRLGALGFLFLPPDAPGNMGLWDQQLALSWVKENAAAFGGDPNRLTLFGHSAGAASVGFHLLSPKSQPLFAQAVLQSGAPNAIWAWLSPEKAKLRSLGFSHLLGCVRGNETDSEVVRCLRGSEAREFGLLEISMVKESESFPDLPFVPTTDGDFLPDDPEKLLETGHLQVKPILMGVTSDEQAGAVVMLYPNTSDGLITWDQLLKRIKQVLQTEIEKDIEAVARKYSEGDCGPAQYRSAMIQALTDYSFICPTAEFAKKIQEAGSPVYFYSFTHHTSGTAWPQWVGATHGAELPYVFQTLESVIRANQTYTEAEAALSRWVMRYWAEFSRSGNPTGSNASEGQWPLYNATQQNFFRLSTESTEVLQRSPAQHCGFLKAHSMKAKKPYILVHTCPYLTSVRGTLPKGAGAKT